MEIFCFTYAADSKSSGTGSTVCPSPRLALRLCVASPIPSTRTAGTISEPKTNLFCNYLAFVTKGHMDTTNNITGAEDLLDID